MKTTGAEAITRGVIKENTDTSIKYSPRRGWLTLTTETTQTEPGQAKQPPDFGTWYIRELPQTLRYRPPIFRGAKANGVHEETPLLPRRKYIRKQIP